MHLAHGAPEEDDAEGDDPARDGHAEHLARVPLYARQDVLPEFKLVRSDVMGSDEETLEDVFIRLVGRSIEDVERLNNEGVKDGDTEEE